MNDSMLPLPGLSPVCGKTVVAKFDGGLLSSDAGILVLREVEQRLRVADRLAACMVDRRAPELITHTLAEIIRFRLLMIGAGYEDGHDASSLRRDPIFKMALDLSPSDRELCSQSTISRLENLPDARGFAAHGPRHGRSLLRVLPAGSQTDHARHRRHVRRGSWRPAIATIQCALRRIRLSADRCVRWRGPLRYRCSSSRQTTQRQGGSRLPAPPVARNPRQLAEDRDSTTRRQSLLQSRGSHLVSGQRYRLHPGCSPNHDIAPAYRGSPVCRQASGAAPALRMRSSDCTRSSSEGSRRRDRAAVCRHRCHAVPVSYT